MNKVELIQYVSATCDCEEKMVTEIVDCFLDSIIATVNRGETVSIYGFGKFMTKDRKARRYQSGILGDNVIEAPAYRAVKFTAGQTFADLVRAGAQTSE